MNLLLYIVLWLSPSQDINIDPSKIAKINEIKEEAAIAYQNGDFEKSIELYSMLNDSLKVTGEDITLNLAHSYYELNQSEKSIEQYQKLQDSKDNMMKSIAYQQLGVLSQDPQNLNKSLAYLKEAIRANPKNTEARYNYELVKKWKNQREKQEQEKQDGGNPDDKQEPSEYAKRLKEQADELVKRNQYQKANALMQGGLEVDETVSFYNPFIQRTKEVADINN